MSDSGASRSTICKRVILRRMTSFTPQDDASQLAPHPHRIVLRGSTSDLQFPPMCPNCGAASAGRLTYAKVFRRSDFEGPTSYVVSSVTVPFCEACVARHRAQEDKRTRLSNWLSGFASVAIVGAIFPGLGALFVLYLALGDLAHGRGMRMLVELGIAAVFGLIAWAQALAVWNQNERFRVPPQSDVTLAFDFSDDVAPVFEQARFICAVRDAAFANSFRALNIGREYLPASPQAQREGRRSNRLFWVFGALLAAFLLWSWLHDHFG
jgi:hypothetical protein